MSKSRGKLYRSQSDRLLAGVAGGLADYFNIDSIIVRLVFVILAITGLFVHVAIVYIALMIIVPNELKGVQ